MNKKVVTIIICTIILILLATGVLTAFFYIRGRKPNNNGGSNNKTKYIYLNNPNVAYEYIDSYKKYSDFMEKQEITKDDEYELFSKNDFKDQTYLFIVVPYDMCSETIKRDYLKKEGSTYRLYLDIAYGCGVCPLAKKVFAYKVDDNSLEVEIFTKEVSKTQCDPNVAYKPIIYIYPQEDLDLTVKLGNKNDLLYTYPKYNNGWNIHVSKDGNIYDYNTKRNYYALYWEGKDNYKLDMSKGFVVKGSDTVKFLEEKLSILGLNDYEINEFIIYWIDKLENNNYNFISFRNQSDMMPLSLSKTPDTLIRVMMDYKPLDNYINVEEQILTKVNRTGFTVVEWGGTKH
ncbi:MAG: hypothetical protein J5892_03190 [Bacilli bacterium]|nr:hypothetical protein [Bacilli bacterium]